MWEVKIVRYIKQSNPKDCASSCIYNIIRYYKGNIKYNNIIKKLNITKKGSSIYNVVKTLRYYGLEADAYKCDYDNIENLKHPIIAYLKINNYYHFVIVKKISNSKVYIFDPIRGDLIYSKEEFISEWENVIIDIKYKHKLDREASSYKKYLIKIIKDNKTTLFIIFILATLFTISNLSSTYFIKLVIDNFDFKRVIVFITIFEIIKNIISFANGKLMLKAYVDINSNIRNSIYQKIFYLPKKEAETFNLVCRMEDLSCISEFIFNFSTVLIDFLYVVIIFIIFIKAGLFYPYLALALIFITVIFHILVRKKLINLFEKERNNFVDLNNNLVEKINLIPTIFKLKASQYFIHYETDSYNKYLLSQKKLNNNMLYYNFIINIIFFILNFTFIVLSYHYNSLNSISLGDFYINYILFNMFFSSMEGILNFDRLFLSSKNAFKRIVDLYDYKFNDGVNFNIVSIYNNEPLLIDTIDNNIIFKRDISNDELNKVKKVCLISGNKMVLNDVSLSTKEKIILARTLLANPNKIILNDCLNNVYYKEKRLIIKNIEAEYKNISLISNNSMYKKRRKV